MFAPLSMRLNGSGLGLQDIAAAIAAIFLTSGLIYLSVNQSNIPPEYAGAQGAAIAWLFMRSAQSAEINRSNDSRERDAGDQTE